MTRSTLRHDVDVPTGLARIMIELQYRGRSYPWPLFRDFNLLRGRGSFCNAGERAISSLNRGLRLIFVLGRRVHRNKRPAVYICGRACERWFLSMAFMREYTTTVIQRSRVERLFRALPKRWRRLNEGVNSSGFPLRSRRCTKLLTRGADTPGDPSV